MKRNTKTNPLQPIKHRVHRHVKHALVPHKANHFRPLLVRRYGLIAVFALVIGLHALYTYTTSGQVLGTAAEVNASELLEATNKERQKYAAAPLVRSQQLDYAAEQKAQDMLARDYWAHTAPDGTEPWHWFMQNGYEYSVAGENLAKNFASAEGVVRAWMDSPSHRENVLDVAYQEVGFATAQGELNGEMTSVVVALYGAPKSAAVHGASVDSPKVAPLNVGVSPMTRFGVALQSLNPISLATSALLLFVGMIAMLAHVYRQSLPKPLRTSWYRHHGLIKTGIIASFMVMTVFLYGGGQI